MSFSPDAAPLAIAAAAAAGNGVDKEFSSEFQASSPNRLRRRRRRRRRCLVCCGACTAVTAAAAVVIIIIALTVYKVREPVMTMNSVTVQGLDLQAPSSGGILAANLTVAADVSVKNPNAATFVFGPSATAVYYRGREVGEVWGPPGTARARRTVRMNVSVDVMASRVATDPAFLADVAAGSFGVSTSTSVGGRVRVFGLVRHHVDVVMNCSFAVAVPAMTIQNQTCRQHFSL